MGRVGAIVAVLLVTGALPGLASTAGAHGTPFPGPFVGAVADDETQTHRFNNHVPVACSHAITTYVLVLEYAPRGDTLSVTVKGQTYVAEGGSTTIVTHLPMCTEVHIDVTGEDVENLAAYSLEVAWVPN